MGGKLYFVRSGALQVRVARDLPTFTRALKWMRNIECFRHLASVRALYEDALLDGTTPWLQRLPNALFKHRRSTQSVCSSLQSANFFKSTLTYEIYH